MAAVTLATLRDRIAKQCEELKRVHAQYLGSLDAQGSKAHQEQEARTRKAKADAKRQLMVAKIRATDAITSAVADASSRAKYLISPQIDNPALRVAEYVEVGHFVIDGRKADVNDDINMPLIAPLLGHNNIVVTGGNPSADAFIRTVISRALLNTEANQLQLVAYDPAFRNPLAPFSALATKDQNMVRTVQATNGMGMGNGLQDIIGECRETVQRVGDMMQGVDNSLVKYRNRVRMPVEQYTLVTLYDYPGEVQEEDHRRLMKLIAEAPSYGISFIIRVSDPANLPKWCSLDEIKSLGTSFDLTHRDPTWNVSDTFPIVLDKFSAEESMKVAEQMAERAKHLQLPIVDFNEIQPKHDWGMSSANGITFSLGREGIKTAEITIGGEDQLHNILITGAVGQGKSNLLKVMIYSMCSRYSPDELELYLLDFKDGVTLAPMAPSLNVPSFLPQARILGLQADQNFGFAVLDAMRKEMERRSRLFKQVDVDNIAKYRAKRPNERLPRIVVVIDEFQMLLSGGSDTLNIEAAKKLMEDVRLGRAYGIHVVLASQTISGIQALATSAQGLFGQFPIRIGLKNSPEEAQATFVQGNLAASRLHYRGQAIVNRDYGKIDSNHTIMVAMAKDDQLNGLQDQWYKRVKDSVADPMVFDGTRPADVERDLIDLKRRGQLGGKAVRVYLGRPVAVDPNPVSFKIDDGMGRNIAIVGGGVSPNALDGDMDNNMAIGQLEAIGLSLAATTTPGAARFVVLDCLIDHDRESNHVGEWLQAMRDLGHDVEVVKRRDAINWINNSDDLLAQHQETDPPVYVMVFAIERCGDFEQRIAKPKPAPEPSPADTTSDNDFGLPPMNMSFGGSAFDTSPTVKEKLFKLFSTGSMENIHMFIWWSSASGYDTLMRMGMGPQGAFDGKLLLYGTNELAKDSNFDGPMSAWNGEENRAEFKDVESMTSSIKLIPYQPLNPQQLRDLVKELRNGR